MSNSQMIGRVHMMLKNSREPKNLIGAVADTYPYEKAIMLDFLIELQKREMRNEKK